MPLCRPPFASARTVRRAALLIPLLTTLGCQKEAPASGEAEGKTGRADTTPAGPPRLSPRVGGTVVAQSIPGPIGSRGPRGWPVGVREDAPADFEVYVSPADGVDLQIAGRLGLLLATPAVSMRIYWVAPPDSMARATSMARQLQCLGREAFVLGDTELLQRLLGASPSRWPALQQAIGGTAAGPRLLSICDNGADRSLDQAVDNRTRLLTLVGPGALGKSVLLDRRGEQPTGWWIGQGATTLPEPLWQSMPRIGGGPPAPDSVSGSAPPPAQAPPPRP